ncbi:MAG: nicotinate (nicotinamide) nucleotide adenylyltransferase [Bacteroidota bacterium]
MLKVGLFFGSFNPVHIGHLSIANYLWQNEEIDEVWMVISPQNPFKEKKGLWNEELRLDLLKVALKGHENIKPCDIEFELPKPSYTYFTLKELRNRFPEHQFSIIIGEDILEGLPKWKNGEDIIAENFFYVYPRTTSSNNHLELKNAKQIAAPKLDISSTYIRENLQQGKDIRFLVGKDVAQFILENKTF